MLSANAGRGPELSPDETYALYLAGGVPDQASVDNYNASRELMMADGWVTNMEIVLPCEFA